MAGKKTGRKNEWSEEKRAAQAERLRKMNADPEFNPLASLTPQQRGDYDVLKKNGYQRKEALQMVLGEGATI